jgi:hypothetical protein
MKKVLQLFLFLFFMTSFVSLGLAVDAFATNYDSFEDALEADIGDDVLLYLNTGYDYDYVHFEVPGGKGGAYNVYSHDYWPYYSLDTYGRFYEENGILWWISYDFLGSDNDSGNGDNFYMEFDLDSYEDYYLKTRPYLSTLSGATYVTLEENVDKYYHPDGGIWEANLTYSDTQLKFLTRESVELYYFSQFNPTLWEEILDYATEYTVEELAENALGAIIAVALGIEALPAEVIASTIIFAYNVVVDIVLPSPEEIISEACYGTQHISPYPESIHYISCVYGAVVEDNDYAHMTRWSSNYMEGLPRERGTFYIPIS